MSQCLIFNQTPVEETVTEGWAKQDNPSQPPSPLLCVLFFLQIFSVTKTLRSHLQPSQYKGEEEHLESLGLRGNSQPSHFTDAQTKTKRGDGIWPGTHTVVGPELEPSSPDIRCGSLSAPMLFQSLPIPHWLGGLRKTKSLPEPRFALLQNGDGF